VKKSSIKSSRVEKGHMDSAFRTACDEKEAKVAATLFGEEGEYRGMLEGESSSFRFLIASACRLGGPRRRLGLSNVHGISSAAQARQGIPDSSHCMSQLDGTKMGRWVL